MRSKYKMFLKSAPFCALIFVLLGAMFLFAPVNKAKASSQIKITYHGQGGTYKGKSNSTEYVNIAYPTVINKGFTYSGYTFLGWSTSSTQSTIAYRGGETVSFTKNIDLYAVWRKNPTTFTIKYYPDPGNTHVCTTQTVTIGSTVTISSSTSGVSKSGYKLAGWRFAKSSSMNFAVGVRVSSNALSTKANTTVELYGVWTCTHTSTAVREKQATCAEEGYKETYCTKCGVTVSKTTYPKNTGNHNWVVAGAGDDNGHLAYCLNCHKSQIQPHHFEVKTDLDGHHWKECVSDGCPHVWEDGTFDACRNHVNDWTYFVDRETYAEKGTVLYIRTGICPYCNTLVTEYGFAGFVSANPQTALKTINALIGAGKFIVKYTPLGKNPVVITCCTAHTLFKVISSGVSAIDSITDSKYEVIPGVDVSWLSRVKVIFSYEGEYETAKVLFKKPQNVYASYQKPQ